MPNVFILLTCFLVLIIYHTAVNKLRGYLYHICCLIYPSLISVFFVIENLFAFLCICGVSFVWHRVEFKLVLETLFRWTHYECILGSILCLCSHKHYSGNWHASKSMSGILSLERQSSLWGNRVPTSRRAIFCGISVRRSCPLGTRSKAEGLNTMAPCKTMIP